MDRPGVTGQGYGRQRRAAGFTLLEIVAALGVMSVAIYILIALFLASVRVGDAARLRDTAASIASEQMQSLVHAPGQFEWPALENGGGAVRVPGAEGEWQPASLPNAMPSVRTAHERESIFYERFGWRAYARPIEGAPTLVEVTVVVQWPLAGRTYRFALTSAVPRASLPAVEDAA